MISTLENRRLVVLAVTSGVASLAAFYLGLTGAGWEAPPAVIVLGALLGTLYGVLAIAIVLIFRASRVINLAIGAIGIFTAAIFHLLAVSLRLPFVAAFPIAVALGAAVGAATDMVIVRRFARAPRILVIVLTLGVAVLLTSLNWPLLRLGDALANRLGFRVGTEPSGEPSFLPELHIGALLVPPRQLLLAILTPLLLATLVFVFYRTRVGLAVRAVAGNTELVRLTGLPARGITTGVWALSAAAAGVATILGPVQVIGAADSSPYSLVLRALVAAVLARMASLPAAFGIGVLTGMVEQVLLWNGVDLAWLDGAILLILLVDGVATRQRLDRDQDIEGSGEWLMVAADTGWPAPYRHMRSVRAVRLVAAVGTIALAGLIPTLAGELTLQTLAAGCGFTLACLSVYVLAGLSGQLSLGQFAIAGIAALVSVLTLAHTASFPLAIAAAVAVGTAAAAIIAVLAVRRPGTSLAALTLTAAGMVPAVLLAPGWALGQGTIPGLPLIAGQPPSITVQYEACLVLLILGLWVTHRLRHGRTGRAMIASRDNPTTARAFGVRVDRTRFFAFLAAGVLASLAGVVIAHTSILTTPDQFAQDISVQLLLTVVVGGVTSPLGAVVGSIWLFTLPQLAPGAGLASAGTAVGGLILLLYFPGGLTHAVTSARNHLLHQLSKRLLRTASSDETAGGIPSEIDINPPSTPVPPVTVADPSRAVSDSGTDTTSAEPLLELHRLSKSFGGLAAVSDLTLTVARGEILALIGPNGAGKTTVFDLASGFAPPSTGRVTFAGQDITRLRPDQRAQLGLIRSFQEPTLFPTMTVHDVLSVAVETQPISRHARKSRVHQALEYYGLVGYRDHRIRELSTGTRRMVELAATHTLTPRLLLLDEPSSGIAQREAEALAGVLLRLRGDFDLTIVLIEHDLPLAFGVADHVAVMLQGQLLTHGTPDRIRNDPAVIDAYIGTRLEPSPPSTAGETHAPVSVDVDRPLPRR